MWIINGFYYSANYAAEQSWGKLLVHGQYLLSLQCSLYSKELQSVFVFRCLDTSLKWLSATISVWFFLTSHSFLSLGKHCAYSDTYILFSHPTRSLTVLLQQCKSLLRLWKLLYKLTSCCSVSSPVGSDRRLSSYSHLPQPELTSSFMDCLCNMGLLCNGCVGTISVTCVNPLDCMDYLYSTNKSSSVMSGTDLLTHGAYGGIYWFEREVDLQW